MGDDPTSVAGEASTAAGPGASVTAPPLAAADLGVAVVAVVAIIAAVGSALAFDPPPVPVAAALVRAWSSSDSLRSSPASPLPALSLPSETDAAAVGASGGAGGRSLASFRREAAGARSGRSAGAAAAARGSDASSADASSSNAAVGTGARSGTGALGGTSSTSTAGGGTGLVASGLVFSGGAAEGGGAGDGCAAAVPGDATRALGGGGGGGSGAGAHTGEQHASMTSGRDRDPPSSTRAPNQFASGVDHRDLDDETKKRTNAITASCITNILTANSTRRDETPAEVAGTSLGTATRCCEIGRH